uniref:CRAL-TRIO domain-containing protein n=1 Tax=Stomoxys calcitrans TaxID=35570 RepID=A0A1I8PN00_STOCA
MAKIRPLPSELQKVAFEELGEVPCKISKHLNTLKVWIARNPQLKIRNDDQLLVQFLRGCKYDMEKAKSKLEQFCNLRSKRPDWFMPVDVDDPQFRNFHNTGTYCSLPTPFPGNGSRIILLQIKFPPTEFGVDEIFRYAASVSEIMCVNDPYACINGVTIVQDYAQATAKHFMLLSPGLVRHILSFYSKAIPIRIKALYYINLSSYAHRFLNVMRPLLPSKLKDRVFLCGSNLDDLGEHFPRNYFPREYGGENGSLAEICAADHKLWDEYKGYFKENV